MADPLRERLEAALGSAYALEHELFGAGMSRVFVATERALGRKVVIKVLPPDLAAGVNRERFQREIQLAAQLQHPHIVPLLSAGEHGDLLYYTMPFIDGESLRSTVDRRGPLPVRQVVRILTDVTEALTFAHSRSVIHRDIKPGNILMFGSHALVTDFGVAKALTAALPTSGSTSTGMAIGTPAYMAPEQLAADPSADHRVDIYAVGLLAYELLTGKSPFEAASPRETLAKQLTLMPPSLESSNPDVPRAFAKVVTHCLQKDPEQRPQTAHDLLRELEELETTTSSLSSSGFPRRRALVVGIAAVSLLGGGLALAMVVRRGSGAPGEPAPLPEGRVGSAVQSAKADTVVIREPAAPIPLTRQDSLAIAHAVESKRAELQAKGAKQVDVESLRVEIERALADSMARVVALLKQGGIGEHPALPHIGETSPRGPAEPPFLPGRRLRVVVFPFTNGTQVKDNWKVAMLLGDSLTRVLAATDFQVAGIDSVRRLYGALNTESALAAIRSSMQVSGTLMEEGDSVVVRLTLRSPAGPGRGRVVRLESKPAPKDQPLGTVDELFLRAIEVLDQAAGRKARTAPKP